jgi:hypothetical protein
MAGGLAAVGLGVRAAAGAERLEQESAPMEMPGHIVWTTEVQGASAQHDAYFVYDPATGLMDIDFHVIREDDWRNLEASRPGETAGLEIPATANMQEILDAIAKIARRGRFSAVEISVRRN